jgi:hypothetical protein
MERNLPPISVIWACMIFVVIIKRYHPIPIPILFRCTNCGTEYFVVLFKKEYFVVYGQYNNVYIYEK